MLIQPYHPQWKSDFNQIKMVLEKGLAGIPVEMEHVGSTSVEHLAAKPIIDIDLVFDRSDLFAAIKLRLEALGYYHNGDQGIPGRAVFKRPKAGGSHPVLEVIKHHLYVCQADNEELARHLAFRDYLREHESARKEYERIKYHIAELAQQDRKAYAQLKEFMARNFVESILEQANCK